jgi:hypothetical protein
VYRCAAHTYYPVNVCGGSTFREKFGYTLLISNRYLIRVTRGSARSARKRIYSCALGAGAGGARCSASGSLLLEKPKPTIVGLC